MAGGMPPASHRARRRDVGPGTAARTPPPSAVLSGRAAAASYPGRRRHVLPGGLRVADDGSPSEGRRLGMSRRIEDALRREHPLWCAVWRAPSPAARFRPRSLPCVAGLHLAARVGVAWLADSCAEWVPDAGGEGEA